MCVIALLTVCRLDGYNMLLIHLIVRGLNPGFSLLAPDSLSQKPSLLAFLPTFLQHKKEKSSGFCTFCVFCLVFVFKCVNNTWLHCKS